MSVKLVKENKVLILALISLIIVGIVILSDFISFFNIQSSAINQLKESQLIKTEYAASQIESHVNRVKDELTTLSKFPITDALDVNKCSGDIRVVHENIAGKINSLLRADKSGNIIECSSPDFSNYLGLNIANKDYFKVPKETNEPFISGIVRQGASQQIIISAPLFETTKYTPYPNFIGNFNGILLSVIELNELHSLYIHPMVDETQSLFLLVNLNAEETILKSNGVMDYTGIKDIFPSNRSIIPAKIDNFGDYGKTIITSSSLIIGHDIWKLIVLTPLKNVESSIESVQKRHLFSFIFVVMVIISIFYFIISLYKSKEKIKEQLEQANVTLEKFGIKIGIEKDKYSQADITLEARKVYLIKEDEENHAHELFISTLNRGFAGLGIVRDDPREIKRKYNLEKTSFIWLTNNKIENIPCETNIENLSKLIEEFVRKSMKSIILIDRLDYILTENRFEDVIKKIHHLNDLALGNDCIIILSLNPELVKEPELKAIEAEAVDLYGKHLKGKVELAELELNILKHINEKNVTSKLASYKDITDNFKITKPTTRAKISKLQSLGLLQVEQKGRFKSLRVTSAGRRIIG